MLEGFEENKILELWPLLQAIRVFMLLQDFRLKRSFMAA